MYVEKAPFELEVEQGKLCYKYINWHMNSVLQHKPYRGSWNPDILTRKNNKIDLLLNTAAEISAMKCIFYNHRSKEILQLWHLPDLGVQRL